MPSLGYMLRDRQLLVVRRANDFAKQESKKAMTDFRLHLSRVSDRLNTFVIGLCAVLLALMLIVSAVGVVVDLVVTVARQLGWDELFGSGIGGWVYANTRPSVVRIFLPWLGMMSITVAFKFGEHIAIDLFSHRLPMTALRTIKVINFLSIALFGVLLVWYGVELFALSSRNTIVSSSLALSQRWTVAAVPLAGFVICVHLADGFRLLKERNAAKQQAGGQDEDRQESANKSHSHGSEIRP